MKIDLWGRTLRMDVLSKDSFGYLLVYAGFTPKKGLSSSAGLRFNQGTLRLSFRVSGVKYGWGVRLYG